jgi:hypothetical protein
MEESDNILFENTEIDLFKSENSLDLSDNLDNSDNSNDSDNSDNSKYKKKGNSWYNKLGKNRPVIIMTVVFIMFILILVYLYMKGRLIFN